MDIQYDEEKKESCAEEAEEIGKNLADGDDGYESEEEDEEVVDLPSELAAQLDSSTYASEEALQSALDSAGIGDLPIILVKGKPRLIMPSDQHNSFTSEYVSNFAVVWQRWGFASGTHKVHLPNGKSRDPDLSYWGYPRCSRNKVGVWVPAVRGSIPDVVIQFSWKNNQSYEEDAIDDMMNRGLEKDSGAPSTTRPAVGYLIKAKFSKKRTLAGAIKGSKTQDMVGLDIYRLPHGTTITDAKNTTNGAEKWTYSPGGQDRHIVITPAELGIIGIWAMLCGEYRIPVSDIYEEMNSYQKERQNNMLAV
jgi:hypothetical protein